MDGRGLNGWLWTMRQKLNREATEEMFGVDIIAATC
jgi:hypothetical protein